MVFNLVIGNHDAHGKNFALLRNDDGRARLAPLYDLVSTLFYPELATRMAMKIGGENRSERVTLKCLQRMAAENRAFPAASRASGKGPRGQDTQQNRPDRPPAPGSGCHRGSNPRTRADLHHSIQSGGISATRPGETGSAAERPSAAPPRRRRTWAGGDTMFSFYVAHGTIVVTCSTDFPRFRAAQVPWQVLAPETACPIAWRCNADSSQREYRTRPSVTPATRAKRAPASEPVRLQCAEKRV